MEAKFRVFLAAAGISDAAISVLEEELILTSVVFGSLREEHFEKLLPKMKVGEHAALLKLWDTSTVRETEVSDLQKKTVSLFYQESGKGMYGYGNKRITCAHARQLHYQQHCSPAISHNVLSPAVI